MAEIALVAAPGPLAERLGEALPARASPPGSWSCRLVERRALAEAGEGSGRERFVGRDWRAVVYLPPRQPVPDPAGEGALLDALAAAGAPSTVVLSSSEVYPPHHHHPGFAAEDFADSRPDRNRVAAAWCAFEAAVIDRLGGGDGSAEDGARGSGSTAPALCILRPAPVPVAGGDDPWSRRLGRRFVMTVPGHDPPLQLLTVDDMAAAIAAAVERGAGGVFNVVPAGTVPVAAAVRLAGAHRLPLPRWLQRLALGGLSRGADADRVEYLRFAWTAGGARAAAELGYRPAAGSPLAAMELARDLGRKPRRVRGTVRPGRSVPRLEEADDRSAPVVAPASAGAAATSGPPAPRFDPFGMDPDYIDAFGRTLFRFLHDAYWRVEHRGLERVPRRGRLVLAGVHRGFMPWDGVMALHLMVRRLGRYPRFLLHPCLLKFPFLHDYMTKLGGIPACRENADRVLSGDGVLGIYPEGIRGAFTPYRRAYRLGKFGRDEYVRMALVNRAPIQPFVTVGSAETYPILGRVDWHWWKRYSEWPYLPLTPTFPWLPLPLPSKWHTEFLEPIHVEEEAGPEAADDRRLVRRISRTVRRRMQAAMDDIRERRPSIFWGDVFTETPPDGAMGKPA